MLELLIDPVLETLGGGLGEISISACAPFLVPSGASCNDGLYCTAVDDCDGAAVCAGSGSPCPADGLACTIELCIEGNDSCETDDDSCPEPDAGSDAGDPEPDASTMDDAGTDASTADDASTSDDASTPDDASMQDDSGSPADDAGMMGSSDADTDPDTDEESRLTLMLSGGGCAIAEGDEKSRSPAGWPVFLLAVLLVRRLRRLR